MKTVAEQARLSGADKYRTFIVEHRADNLSTKNALLLGFYNGFDAGRTPLHRIREILQDAGQTHAQRINGALALLDDVLPASQPSRMENLERVLRDVGQQAKNAYDDDCRNLMAAPPGNPNNCWAEHTKHTQTLAYIHEQCLAVLDAADSEKGEK